MLGHNLSLLDFSVAIAISFGFYLAYSYFTNPLKVYPGPWHTRISGVVSNIYTLRGTRTHWVERLHKKYGEVVRFAPRQLSVTDEESVSKVIAFNTTFFKDPDHYSTLSTRPAIGNLFTLVKKADHAHRRRMFTAAFSKANILRLEPFVVQKAKLLATQYFRRAGVAVDVLVWHRFFASDIINKVGFDIDLHSVDSGKQHQFITDLDNLLFLFVIDSLFHPLYLAMRYLTSRFASPDNSWRKFWTASERCYDLFSTPILAKYTSTFSDSTDRPEIIAKLLHLLGDPKSGLTMHNVETELTDLNIAGTDTTSMTMTYLLWRLTQNPDWYHKVKDELDQAIPDPTALPPFVELEQLRVLTACIKETLRIDCAFPGPQPRRVGKDGAVIAGKPVREDAIISVLAYSCARNTTVWGKDATEWNPERWFSVTKAQSGTGFRTFGGGAHVCMGMHLAYVELYVLMALIIRLFDIEAAPGFTPDQMVQFDHSIGHPRDYKCLLVFKPRQKTAATISHFETTQETQDSSIELGVSPHL